MLELSGAVKKTLHQRAIERLRQAAAEEGEQVQVEGREAGELWAREEATPRQLRGLKRRLDAGDPVQDADGNNAGAGYRAIHGWKFEIEEGAVDAFWSAALGGDPESAAARIADPDFARGFCEGAVEFWNKVADQL